MKSFTSPLWRLLSTNRIPAGGSKAQIRACEVRSLHNAACYHGGASHARAFPVHKFIHARQHEGCAHIEIIRELWGLKVAYLRPANPGAY